MKKDETAANITVNNNVIQLIGDSVTQLETTENSPTIILDTRAIYPAKSRGDSVFIRYRIYNQHL